MIKRILVAIDGSEAANKANALAKIQAVEERLRVDV